MAPQTERLLPGSRGLPPLPARRPLLQVAWQRKWRIAAAVLVGLALGAGYCVQSPAVYQSMAEVVVLKKPADVITAVDSRAAPVEDYVSTHQFLVRSPLVIDRAVAKRRLRSLSSLAGETDLAESIKKALSVSRNRGAVGESNVLQVTYRGKDADDCQAVLSAVLESYKDFLDETYRAMSNDTLKVIAQSGDRLKKDVEQKEAAYAEFAKKSPLPGKVKEGLDLRARLLEPIQAERSSLLLRRANAQAQLKAIETARKDGHSREALVALVSEFAGRPDAADTRRDRPITLQEQLLPLLLEEEKLLGSLGPRHPDVLAVRKRIEAAREFFTRPSPAWREPGAGKAPLNPATDAVERYVRYLGQKLNEITIAEDLHAKLFSAESAEYRKLAVYAMEDEKLQAGITRARELHDSDDKRAYEVGLIMAVGGYYPQTISPPAVGRQIAPKPLLIVPATAFLGLICGLGWAYLAAVTDKRFRCPDEVPQQLGIPLVGSIPLFKPDGAAGRQLRSGQPIPDPMLCTYYRPRSLEAEAFRSLRTALYFSALGEGCKVIQITSPNAQEGKSTLAANLAVSIAQSGKRVVLVDADLRTPQVHKMLGLAASAGLASVLAGAAEPNDAVLPSSIPGLSVLACGPVPPNPAELLTSPAFKDLLDLLRDRSDFVIVDTPPLLAVTDASVVASRVDGVLLTLRLSRSSQPAAAGAAQALAAVGAPLLGVIVNATDRRAGPAGYHQGHYLDQGAGRYTVAVSANGTDPDRGADGPASGNTQNGSH